MAKRSDFDGEHFARERALDDSFEVARASKATKLVPAYNPVIVFSLSRAGNVRQAMTFRRPEEDYTHGSAWNLKKMRETVEGFQTWAGSNSLVVEMLPKAKRINYEKSIRVGQSEASKEQRKATREATREERAKTAPAQTPAESLDEKMTEAEVIRLRLEGLSYKKIEERLGKFGKKGFWAMKIIRRVEAGA
jgi:hypothetical protein